MDNQKDKPVVITADSFAKKNTFKFSIVNPKFLGITTVLLLLVVGVGTGVYLTQRPQQATTQASLEKVNLSFQPSQIEATTGEGFNVDVFANAGSNQVISTKLTIKYDPAVLNLVSITPKQFLPKVLSEPIIASGSATFSLGTDGAAGAPGNGILASLSFLPKSSSSTTTQISFDGSQTSVNVLNNPTNLVGDLGTTRIKITPRAGDVSKPQVATPSATQTSATTEFDLNSDGQLNALDLAIMRSLLGKPASENPLADINKDGIVNGLDYALLLPQMQR